MKKRHQSGESVKFQSSDYYRCILMQTHKNKGKLSPYINLHAVKKRAECWVAAYVGVRAHSG